MRASGQTTRLVDEAIQTLFTTGSVVCKDHHDNSRSHTRLMLIVVDRLQQEHGMRVIEDYTIDRGRYKIKLA